MAFASVAQKHYAHLAPSCSPRSRPSLACSARPRRYVFHYDGVAEVEAQGLPYVLVPRVLSRREWMERYAKQ
jgi:hypothetical protein